jgi:hypothetical protein
MAENMYCPTHKASNKKFRDGWERTFGKKRYTPEQIIRMLQETEEELDALLEELEDWENPNETSTKIEA